MTPTTAAKHMPLSVDCTHADYYRERYLSVHAAEYLCLSTDVLYRLVANHQIGCRRAGAGRSARLLFSQADLDRWRASYRVEANGEPRPLGKLAPVRQRGHAAPTVEELMPPDAERVFG